MLTDEQRAECSSPRLQLFALAFLRFQKSSPYTTERKLFRYFEPLKTEQLEERDILFGSDREQTYRDLMTEFKACLFTHAFDRFFDDAHKHYYKFQTIPGLIIFKKWVDADPQTI